MVFACLLALFTPSECWAQVNYEFPLKGLKSIHLLVEDLNEESQRCGITEPLIHDAFMFPASSSKINISNDRGPTFYVKVATLFDRLGCFSLLKVEVYINQSVKLNYIDGPPAFVHVRLWQEERLITSKIEEHGQRIRNNVENSTKNFLTEWNLANRP
jgi:hypothetical protein